MDQTGDPGTEGLLVGGHIRCSCAQTLIKTLGTQSFMSFPVDNTYLRCCHDSLFQELSVHSVIFLREDSWNLVPGFLWLLTHAPFPVADFAL